MPKATSGGASNAWEQGEPEVAADAATEAQSEAVAAEEPESADAEAPAQAETVTQNPGPVADGPALTDALAPVGGQPASFTLPPGWTSEPTPPVPVQADPVQVDVPPAPGATSEAQPPEPGD
jgi:hypothetical protein